MTRGASGGPHAGQVARSLAVGSAVLAAAMLAGGLALSAASKAAFSGVFVVTLLVAFVVVGIVVALQQPENSIGWLFLGVGVATGLGSLAGSYADYWVAGSGGDEGLAEAAAVYGNAGWVPFILPPATFLLLLFPDGHLISRRWRVVAWAAGLGIALVFLSELLHPGPITDHPEIRNPIGVEGVGDALGGLGALFTLIGLIGSAAALVVRYRRAQDAPRDQIKWLALAGGIAASAVVVGVTGNDVWGDTGTNVICMLGVISLPVAAGIAIVRHRLYDIDVVINRTLVYGALTALLAGAYLGAVLLLQLVLDPLTSGSELAVAGSTLTVAALFRPARGRIQSSVDRRFFRRRYDAAHTLEVFSSRLREETDLRALRRELEGVIAETMQPAHLSLWMPEPRA